jgi:hypothetical protein
MKFLLPFILSAYPFAAVAQSPSPSAQPPSDAPSPKTTEVMVILTANDGVAAVDSMPLSKENLVDHEYIPGGPLMPLSALIAR